jgi:hypothetical protein
MLKEMQEIADNIKNIKERKWKLYNN